MRPNTSESGIFSTKRNRPVSTSMLTRMLVPKPKKAFQSVAVHSTGLRVVVIVPVMTRLPSREFCLLRSRYGDGHLGAWFAGYEPNT